MNNNLAGFYFETLQETNACWEPGGQGHLFRNKSFACQAFVLHPLDIKIVKNYRTPFLLVLFELLCIIFVTAALY